MIPPPVSTTYRGFEVYAAPDVARSVRGAAAAMLASAHARLRRPYEAAEWLERAVREGMDPGGEIQGAVAAAGRGLPGLAERASDAAQRLDALRAVATRPAGFLGVKVGEADGRGVRVEAVAKGSPAEGALRAGDVVTAVGGAATATPADLQAALAAAGAGAEVDVRFERGGEALEAKVSLAPQPAREPEYAKAPSRV